jgi:elongation factor G
VRDRLNINAAAVQVNIGVENGLNGIVDLVKMKAYYFDGESGQHVREEEIPADLLEFCKQKKAILIEALAEQDEKMEEYFLEETIDVPEDELKAAIRK